MTVKAKNTKSKAPKVIELPPIAPPKEAPEKPKDAMIPLAAIVLDSLPNRWGQKDQRSIHELAQSMNELGLQQPIGVIADPDTSARLNKDGSFTEFPHGRYRLIFGHRRVEAAKLLKWETIKAQVFRGGDDEDVLRRREVENIHRADLSPVEIMGAVVRLIDIASLRQAGEMGRDLPEAPAAELLIAAKTWTPGQIKNAAATLLREPAIRAATYQAVASQLGKPVQWVRDHAFLSRLDSRAQEKVFDGTIELAYARELAKVADVERQGVLLEELLDAIEYDEHMPIDEFRRRVGANLYSLAQVSWKLDQGFAGDGPCISCPHNSANSPGLFEHGTAFANDPAHGGKLLRAWMETPVKEEPEAGVCTRPECYTRKAAAAKQAISDASQKLKRQVIKTSELKGNARILPTPSEAARVAVDYVDPAKVAARVKESLDAGKAKAGKKSAAKAKDSVPYYKKPEYVAHGKWVEACREYTKKLEPQLVKELGKKPGSLALLHCLMGTAQVKGMGSGQPKTRAKYLSSTDLAAMIKMLTHPSLESLIQIEKHAGFKFGIFDRWAIGHSALAEKIAIGIGLEVEALPDEKKFIDAEKAKHSKPSAAEHADAGRKTKVGKKSKKPKAPPGGVGDIDNEEDEP